MNNKQRKEYLERTIFQTEIENITTNDFIDTYKNYGFIINGFFSDLYFIRIVIYRLNDNNDLIKVYENDYIEEIYEIFGKNLKDNSRNTVKSKVKNFIKTYLE